LENSASTTSSGSALSGRKPGQRRSKLLITTDLLLVHPGEAGSIRSHPDGVPAVALQPSSLSRPAMS
jgi:hypothetical protein